MKDIAGHVITNKQNATKPPAHMSPRPDTARNAELGTNVDTVVGMLEALGHCPVTELVQAAQSEELTPQQKAAVNRWLMEHAYAKPKSVEITGNVEHDHSHRAVSSVDEFIAGFLGAGQESDSEEAVPH